LPEPLRGNETGTFTAHSVNVRLPDIARRILEDHPTAAAELDALIEEIGEGPIRPLTGNGPHQDDWDGYVDPFVGIHWPEVPWFFAEYYFYRRILDAVGYWESGVDPYHDQKQLGLEQAIRPAASRMETVDAGYAQGASTEILLIQLTDAALWGNQVDLSLWPAEAGQEVTTDQNADRVLIDDRPQAIRPLHEHPPLPIDLVVDNAGSELVADLLVADLLLRSDLASRITIHAKLYPIFVSDATERDVVESIRHLAADTNPHLRSVGERLHMEFTAGRLVIAAEAFWVSPVGWRSRPATVDHSLSGSGLVIVKGDANYRRLLDDRHWDFTTPFAVAIGSTPAPLLALRTIKSELVAGLAPGQPAATAAIDPEWLQNGRWATASFAD
jgi:uncharacterized protein with ATP-grasp and redox domains